jgi:glycosyltransferase involved in cell wall biosynthesis
VVQHRGLIGELTGALGIDGDRVRVVGAGYREDLFHARGRQETGPALAYVGKYAHAKGLPWLLDAYGNLRREFRDLPLHVVGSGAGTEAEALKERMQGQPGVVLHGQLPQPELAEVLRRASVFVMPSFYEGVPLVLVEALACGCWPVANRLPGIVDQMSGLGEALELVPLPGLTGPDRPEPSDLPAFVENLTAATRRALARPPLGDPENVFPGMLDAFRWGSVFSRVEAAWKAAAQRSI